MRTSARHGEARAGTGRSHRGSRPGGGGIPRSTRVSPGTPAAGRGAVACSSAARAALASSPAEA